MEIRLDELGRLVTACWNDAEAELSRSIATKYFGPKEEYITFLFASELRATIDSASRSGAVARAFASDLRRSVPELDYGIEWNLRHLAARVNFHNPRHEGKHSGSDLGIVIRRPFVSFDSRHIKISFDHATGLLAQAKLGVSKDKTEKLIWSRFTKDQQRLFPEISSYYSLLLYRLHGERQSDLERFRWQLCAGHALIEAKGWLRSSTFPEEVPSSELLRLLFARAVGTQDVDIIRRIIDPEVPTRQVIELHIFWPPGEEPPQTLRVQEATHQAQYIQQRSG